MSLIEGVINWYDRREKMITTIIFDIGNVLAEFTWKEHYELSLIHI